MYKSVFDTPIAPTRPPNWTRSRIRRQHLISLGIPINLDEMLPHANGKPLPALHITTRPSSAPPTPRQAPVAIPANSGSVTRSSTPKPSKPPLPSRSESGLGPPPELDRQIVNELLALDTGWYTFPPCLCPRCLSLSAVTDNLSFMPLQALNAHLSTLQALTATSSSLLSHLLQSRALLQEESENYNATIGELIAKEALKMQTGKAVKRQNSYRKSGR